MLCLLFGYKTKFLLIVSYSKLVLMPIQNELMKEYYSSSSVVYYPSIVVANILDLLSCDRKKRHIHKSGRIKRGRLKKNV